MSKVSQIITETVYFTPSDMVIKVPQAENFRSLSEYCKTYLHELSHATGAKSILGRFKDMPDADAMIAMQSYSREELVAELSASIRTILNGSCDIIPIPTSLLFARLAAESGEETRSPILRTSRSLITTLAIFIF